MQKNKGEATHAEAERQTTLESWRFSFFAFSISIPVSITAIINCLQSLSIKPSFHVMTP